jgi:uncharacterized protein YbjQ (UPF0145 family)
MGQRLIVTTTNEVAGYRVVEYLGVARGIVVRSPGIGRSFTASFSAIGGGNIREYEDMCEEARREAHARMVDHASDRGADAIIGMRYDATEMAQNMTEVLAYGTAVQLAPLEPRRAERVEEAGE